MYETSTNAHFDFSVFSPMFKTCEYEKKKNHPSLKI